MRKYRFAGYRVVEFSPSSKKALREIALRLMPSRKRIVDTWIRRQWSAWQPPGLTRAGLREVFGGMFHNMLDRMAAREPELLLDDLERTGKEMAASRFPFEALVISVHFLEESYTPLLLDDTQGQAGKWFVAMDEFLHAALAAIATSYFEAYRSDLLDEVEVGRVVQEGLVPDIPKRVADLDVAHAYISAHEKAQLGGDFLDAFELDGGRAVFTIGDLSGHGLEAAADSVSARALFRGFARERPDLPEAMSRVSRVLSAELRSDQFATMLAIDCLPGGKVTLVGAGHPYPVVCDSDGCRLVKVDGLALGILESASYQASDLNLQPGGVIVAYTDGLIEARAGGDQFGDKRLTEAVAAMRDAGPRAIAEQVVDESLRHSGGRFVDDVAVLVLKRRA